MATKNEKIWFTEYGFPSMNGCTNEPNVFVDKGSIESKYPRYSNGEVSFLSQKIAIEGTLKKWQSSEMVEKMFLWAWDARPFPYFPNLCDVWADCHNWQTGHWIQGKLSQLNISDVLSDLLQKAGLKSDQFDTGGVKGLLSGYVINDQQPVRSIIKMLQSCYFFDVVEQDSKLKFIQKGRAVTTEIPIGEMVFNNSSKSMQLVNISQLDLNNKVNVVYFNRNFGYPIDVKYAELPKQGTAIIVEISLIMEEGEAQNIAEVLLYPSWQERNKQSTYGYVMESTDEGLIVVLRFGKLPSTSPIANSNLALVGKEVIKFQNAELIDKNKYKLSNLIRGQEGTKDTAGEKFVLLDNSIISFEVQRGKKFYLKAVTYGDSLDNTEAKVLNN